MTKYKLTYFNSRGRGEPIRYIFAAGGVEYEDCRIERDASGWPEAVKAATPFGQLPMLEVDGVKLCQSNSCARFLARKFNLAGKTELEQAQADMFVDCVEDSIKPFIFIFTEKDETKKAELKKKYADEQLPGYLTNLEAMLKANQSGDKFLVGSDMTWADLVFITFVDWTGRVDVEKPLEKFPKLLALQHRVENLPKIKAWIESRPKTAH